MFLISSCASLAAAETPEPTATPAYKPVKVQIPNIDLDNTEPVIRVDDPVQSDSLAEDDELSVESCRDEKTLSVWAPGHVIGKQRCNGITPQTYQIPLLRIDTNTNSVFPWTSAAASCQGCHGEYAEWQSSGHANTLREIYLETMYSGRNAQGNFLGSRTEWVFGNNGRVRTRPNETDPSKYSGPGFHRDYPNENGSCVFCHAPAAVNSSHINVDLTGSFFATGGAVGEGITCDICHRVVGVILDDDGYPYPDRPGILSFEYPYLQTYPPVYLGPFIAVNEGNTATHDNSCLPALSESSFCAACHYGRFYDMVIYNSYGEWMDSPYSWREVPSEGDRKENKDYRSCQDCHMLSADQINGTLPGERDACSPANTESYNFDHNMMHDREGKSLITGAASLDADLKFEAETNSMKVIVRVMNIKAGHNFPTDSPLRHLILVVEAKDEQGNLLPQIKGDRIPAWGGIGNTSSTGMTNYGDLPGRIFANLLVDKDTNESPTAAYWNPTKFLWENVVDGTNSDSRLRPFVQNKSEYSFSLPSRGRVVITVKLIYRFAFIDLALQKGWHRPDIPVAEAECQGPLKEIENIICEKTHPLP